jgi:two-component system chemotaxis sensor kinase CheA
LAEQARALARRLDKGEIQVEIEANGVRLDAERWDPLFSELGHVMRNAVDHGIEPPDERGKRSKPLQGKISIKAQVVANTFTIQIADDGRGIDWDAISEKAKQKGLPHATAADLLNVLCRDGITTRSDVSSVSGRGVGMAAVKERVTALNGRIDVKSTPGFGTTWILSFPWSVPGPKASRFFESGQVSKTG